MLGRHRPWGSPPSRLAPYRHYTRKIRTRITPVSRCRAHHSCGLAVGRDVPIAPPRHRRGARLGIPRPRRAAWSRAPWCGMAVRPVSGALGVTRRRALRGYRGRTETPPAKLSACATCHANGTLRTRGAHGGAMGTSRPTAIARALPTVAHRLCAPIHPAQKLFVPLCVQNFRTPRVPASPFRHYMVEIRTQYSHAGCASYRPWGFPTPWGLPTAGSSGSDSFTPAESKIDSESFFAGVMPSSRTVSILRTRLPFPSNS